MKKRGASTATRTRGNRFSQTFRETNQNAPQKKNPLYNLKRLSQERDLAKQKWENLKVIRAAYKREYSVYKKLKQQHAVVNNYQHVKVTLLTRSENSAGGNSVIEQSMLDKLLVLALLAWRNDRCYDDVKQYVLDGANVNWASYFSNGLRPVHIAAQNGHIDTLLLLIKYNANISLTDNNGMTALHIASQFHQISIVRALIEASINVNLEDNFGRSALHTAIHAAHGIEREIYSTKEVQLFYLHHAFDMLDKGNAGMIHKSDLLNVLLQHKDTKQNIDDLNKTLSGHRRVDFGTFLNGLLPAQRYLLLQRTVKSLIDTQNEIVRLLLNTYPVAMRKSALMTRDNNGQVAFSLNAREHWYLEKYEKMKTIFQNPLETGYGSEIFKDARTMLAVETEWNTVVRPSVLKKTICQVIYALVITIYVSSTSL